MREIKFRAWDKEEQVMCGVRVINLAVGASLSGNTKTGVSIQDGGRVVSIPIEDYGHFVNFENMELMQYTGLKDKNGKEMYEGDILEVRNFLGKVIDTCKVEYKHFGFSMTSFQDPEASLYYSTNLVKIIGNIYENKELIK